MRKDVNKFPSRKETHRTKKDVGWSQGLRTACSVAADVVKAVYYAILFKDI